MTQRTLRRASLVVLAALLCAPTALADGLADEADLHFRLGTSRFNTGDYLGALEHFFVSNRLVRNRNVLFNIAGTYEQLGRFPEAHRYYIDALEGEGSERIRTDVTRAITRLAPRVAVLRVESDPPNARIYLDRRDLGQRGTAGRALALAPGSYRVIVEQDGYEPVERTGVSLALGDESVVRVALRRIVGNVAVSQPAGATLRIDDEQSEQRCVVPCSLEAAPGTHTVYLSRDGYNSETRAVVVTARTTTTLSAALRAQTGSIVVGADERDALVEVDGRIAGFTPVVLREIPVGTRTVRVTLRGFAPVERTVTVVANREANLSDFRLVPLREVTAASRVTERIEDAPASITVVSAAELQAFAPPTIASAVEGVRGVYLSNDRSYNSIGIRGLGQPNDYGNRLLVLQDGTALNDNLLYSSYVGHDGRSDMLDVERIEVVRGPGSLLYGTGAISGVVNLVMRGREPRTSALVGLSTYDNHVARARAGGSIRFGRDAGVWASVAIANGQGVDQTLDLPSPTGGAPTQQTVRVDRFLSSSIVGRIWAGALSAQWLLATHEHTIPVGTYGTAVGDDRTVWFDGRAMLDVRFEPKITQTLQLFTRLYGNAYQFNGSYGYSDGTLNTETYLGVWGGAEARAVWTPIPALRLTAGGAFELHPVVTLQGGSRTTIPGTMETTERQYLNASRPYYVGSAYALGDWTITPAVKLSAGARLDAFSTVPLAISPRLALVLRPHPTNTLKLMFGRAFRAPSTYEQAYTDEITQAPGCPDATRCDLRPEVITSGEVEFTQRIGDSWSAMAAANVSYLTDVIDTVGQGIAGDPLRYRNSETAVLSVGGDVEVRREFRQGWLLVGSYNVQHTRFLDPTMADPLLTNAPSHQAGLRMIAPIVPTALNAALRVTVVGPRRVRIDEDEVTPPAFVADLVFNGAVSRLGLRYAIGVYNIADWRWSVPVVASSATRTIAQSGRSFMASLTAQF